MAATWWDPNGNFKALHDINPIRLDYIISRANKPLSMVLDVGCGGGILTESLCDHSDKTIGIEQCHLFQNIYRFIHDFLSLTSPSPTNLISAYASSSPPSPAASSAPNPAAAAFISSSIAASCACSCALLENLLSTLIPEKMSLPNSMPRLSWVKSTSCQRSGNESEKV